MAEPFVVQLGVLITVTPGLPIEEVLDLLERHQPWAVGFSVALGTSKMESGTLGGKAG